MIFATSSRSKNLAFEVKKKEIRLRNANNGLLFKVIYRLCDGFYL